MTHLVKTFVISALTLCAVCAAVFAQSPETDESNAATASYLRVNGQEEAEVSFGSDGGMKTLTVSTDGGDYDITFLPAWCSADKYGTSFSLTCEPNQTSSDRSDFFNVGSGYKTVKVTVSQSGIGGSGVSSAAKKTKKDISSPAVERRSVRGRGLREVPSNISVSAGERRIDISSSFSYYFNGSGRSDFDSTAPAAFTPSHFSNLSLSMGLNIYKSLSAYFDIGINNQTVKKTIDWAGRIGSKYFDLQVEYNFIGGRVSYWNDANIGANKDTPPDLTADYDQTWLTVALMYPLVFSKEFSRISGFGLIGLFYNYAKVPALIWVNRYGDDNESKFAFLDKSCPVTTFGIRFYSDNIGFIQRIPAGLPMGWTAKIPLVRFTVGAGLGFADPDKDVIAMAAEKGGQFTDYSFPTYYLDARLTLGTEFFNRFTENQIVHLGTGVEFHGLGYIGNDLKLKEEGKNGWKRLDNWSSIMVGGLGLFVRVGYAW